MSELGYYGMFNIHWPWCVQKNHIIIFCSLLDIRENVLLDIPENVEWPRFLDHPVDNAPRKIANSRTIFDARVDIDTRT